MTTNKSGGYKWEGTIEQIEESIKVASKALAGLQERDVSYTRRLELTGQISAALMTAFTGISQLNRIATGWSDLQQRQIERLEAQLRGIEQRLGK